MTTGHAFMAMSLDGFVARPDRTVDWLNDYQDTGEETGFDAFMNSVDGLVMGRGSFETVLGFGVWPYTKPVMVMSKSMTAADIPEDLQGKVEITALDPVPLMAELDARGWSRAYVDGGAVIRSFLRDDLMRSLCVTVVPILIGDGIRMFGPLEADRKLTLTGSKVFRNGLVQLTYSTGDEASPS